MTLTDIMKKLEPLSRKRDRLEGRDYFGSFFGGGDSKETKEEIDVAQLERDEQRVYQEFEDFVKREGISEDDLHSKLEHITEYGAKLYQIAFKINPNIFSEKTVVELTNILSDYRHYLEWEAYRFPFDENETPDRRQYEYPLWSLGFILDLNPSLINEDSFSNLLQALDNHLEIKGQFVFHEDEPPNPLDYFASLCGDAEKYTSLLIKNKLTAKQVNELIEGNAIDSRVVLEAEKYLKEDTYENALLLLKRVGELKPEYILLGWRNCIESAYELLPFAKEVPKENFATLEQNIEKYGFSSSVSVPLAIGNRQVSGEEVQELRRISEGCLKGCKLEVSYYFTLALLDKRLTVPSIERFASAVKGYYSIEKDLANADGQLSEYMSKICNLDDSGLERLSIVIERSKTQSSNWFRVPERDRFQKIMEGLEDIVKIDPETMNRRLTWLNTFESTRGDINPDTYVKLLVASDDKSFYSLWERMQDERLYEFHIEDSELSIKMESFRNKYLDKEKEPIEYTEEARAFRFFKSQFDHRSKKDIDVIFYIANEIGVDPYAVSQKTVNDRYKALAGQYHPDKNGGEETKFNVIADSKELLLGFIKYRDKKLKDKFGSLLPVKYVGNVSR